MLKLKLFAVAAMAAALSACGQGPGASAESNASAQVAQNASTGTSESRGLTARDTKSSDRTAQADVQFALRNMYSSGDPAVASALEADFERFMQHVHSGKNPLAYRNTPEAWEQARAHGLGGGMSDDELDERIDIAHAILYAGWAFPRPVLKHETLDDNSGRRFFPAKPFKAWAAGVTSTAHLANMAIYELAMQSNGALPAPAQLHASIIKALGQVPLTAMRNAARVTERELSGADLAKAQFDAPLELILPLRGEVVRQDEAGLSITQSGLKVLDLRSGVVNATAVKFAMSNDASTTMSVSSNSSDSTSQNRGDSVRATAGVSSQ